MRYVLLSSFDNYVSAHIALGRLEEEYINCHLQNEHTASLSPHVWGNGGIRLLVAESQLERAQQVLAALRFQ